MIVLGIEAARIDDAQPQLPRATSASRRRQGSAPECPASRSSGNGPRVAQQAQPALPVDDDCAAARRIARRSGQRCAGWHRRRSHTARRPSPVDAARRRSPHSNARARRSALVPNRFSRRLRAVIVRNQPSAMLASAARVAAGASSGLMPPAPCDLDELAIDRVIYAGDRDAVIGRDQAVAGVDQLRRARACRRPAAPPRQQRRPWPGRWRQRPISASRRRSPHRR